MPSNICESLYLKALVILTNTYLKNNLLPIYSKR